MSPCRVQCGEEAPHTPFLFMPRQKRLVTHTVAERKPSRHFPAILTVEAIEVTAQIQELAGRLGKILNIAKQEAGNRIVRYVCVEREESRLLKQIVDIHLRI